MSTRRFLAAVCLVLAIAATFIARPAAAQPVEEDNPVPKLLENIESDNLQVASSAARSLGIVFSPGGKGGDEVEEATTALIDALD